MNAPIRNIAIVGSGSAAWIAAAALKRAFKHFNPIVTVIDNRSAREPIGTWTLPSQRGMHALLGIGEGDFVARTGATYKLATEHVGWQGEGSGFLHAHGDIGHDLGGLPFYKLLLRETDGRRDSPDAYSLAAAAARRGRFARPMSGADLLTSSFTFGYHIASAPYRMYLREHALRSGVRRIESAIDGAEFGADGNLASLKLKGESLAADLFIDCSGRDCALMRLLPPGERDHWSEWLRCDRMLSALAPAAADSPAVTRTVAAAAGWHWSAPLLNTSMTGYVYSSAFASDAAALEEFRRHSPDAGDPVLTEFSPGRRRAPWVHNCVALGSAAVEIEPLAGADLHFAQLGLATLIELWPRAGGGAIEAGEFNRVMADYADALRDFTLAHYRIGNTRPEPFWAAARAEALPPRLAHKLELFAASGRIHMYDFESFEETDWAWLLLGGAVPPAANELQTAMKKEQVPTQERQTMQARIQKLATSMPAHLEYVRRVIAQAHQAPR